MSHLDLDCTPSGLSVILCATISWYLLSSDLRIRFVVVVIVVVEFPLCCTSQGEGSLSVCLEHLVIT